MSGTEMKALVAGPKGEASVKTIPEPSLRPDYIKVKVLAVALNPTDWKHISYVTQGSEIIGCDLAGEVLSIGSSVKTSISPGDKIYGFVNGGNLSNHQDGAFAQTAVVKDGLFAKIPSSTAPEAASTMPLGLVTCGQGMYQALELPWPNAPAKDPFPVLIYGGSTATGMLAIQLAKASGLTVVATARERNFELLKGYGADAVFDYTDPECGAKIREYTEDKLEYVFDCISEKGSVEICMQALASKPVQAGGKLKYATLLRVPEELLRSDVKLFWTIAYTAIGEAFEKFGATFEAKSEDYDFARKFVGIAGELVSQGSIRPANYEIRSGGLEGILDGLKDLEEGRISGTKLVYRIAA